RFLDNSNGGILSPSAINTWLNCRMKFYYRYINGLKEPGKVTKDIDPAMLGNILHEIMKNIYQGYKNQFLTAEILNSFISNKKFLFAAINNAINEKFKDGRNGSISGNELIVRDVLMAYLIKILNVDITIAPVTILNLEDPFSFKLEFNPNGLKSEITVGGKVDRIDVIKGVTRVVDYKTGTVAEMIKSTDDLFTDDRKKEADGWLQTLIYCEAYLANKPESVVRPSVYAIRKLTGGFKSDRLRMRPDNSDIMVDDYKMIREGFLNGLKGIINTIFSKEEPFVMTKDIRTKCTYCPYKTLCMR
ncbi:MAG: PD-(D/E)XK nuclease family protein, partial [Bacteroidetes bacterium]